MDKNTNFVTAKLSPTIISEIKSFEERISQETHKNVVVIAYENEQNQVNEF